MTQVSRYVSYREGTVSLRPYYPITTVPLSLAHSDGTPLKTGKSTLTKTLESRQDVVVVDVYLPPIKATISDGGILLYESAQQIHVRSYDECVLPSRRANSSTTRQIQVSIHQGCRSETAWRRHSECIHHNRPRPSPATEWNGAPQKRGIQGRVCQEEGPLWTSNWQRNDLHLTWWKMHDDAEQQRT